MICMQESETEEEEEIKSRKGKSMCPAVINEGENEERETRRLGSKDHVF